MGLTFFTLLYVIVLSRLLLHVVVHSLSMLYIVPLYQYNTTQPFVDEDLGYLKFFTIIINTAMEISGHDYCFTVAKLSL